MEPLIAGTLYRRGVIDSLGSGTLRMLKASREAGLFEPEIQDTGTSVRVDFPRAGAPPVRFHGISLNASGNELLRLVIEHGSMAFENSLQHSQTCQSETCAKSYSTSGKLAS